jgi:dsRNA-specific ribonuclease
MEGIHPNLSELYLGLQKRLGYQFLDPSLLVKAFRHRKYTKSEHEFFDRLEKAGDAVLKLAVGNPGK